MINATLVYPKLCFLNRVTGRSRCIYSRNEWNFLDRQEKDQQRKLIFLYIISSAILLQMLFTNSGSAILNITLVQY